MISKKVQLTLLIPLLATTILTRHSYAAEDWESVEFVQNREAVDLNLGPELAMLQRPDNSLSSYGLRVGIQFSPLRKFALELGLSNHLSGASVLYTGLGIFGRYALFGHFGKDTEIYKKQGKVFLEYSRSRRSVLAIAAGMEQLFFHGSEQVFSASGISVSAGYNFPIASLWIEPSLRYGLFSSQGESLTAIFGVVNIIISLSR